MLNLFDADFTTICNDLSKINWEDVWKSSNLEDFPKLLYDTVLNACMKSTPLKEQHSKKPKKDYPYRRMLRKLKKLKHRLKCIELHNPSSSRAEVINQEILNIKEQIKNHSFKTLDKLILHTTYFPPIYNYLSIESNPL